MVRCEFWSTVFSRNPGRTRAKMAGNLSAILTNIYQCDLEQPMNGQKIVELFPPTHDPTVEVHFLLNPSLQIFSGTLRHGHIRGRKLKLLSPDQKGDPSIQEEH